MQEAMLSDLRQPDRRFADQWSNKKADREAGQLFLFLLVAVVGNLMMRMMDFCSGFLLMLLLL